MVFALKVTAPATLDEGYSFDATVDGRVFRVTVPEGGVTAGEEFTVYDSHEVINTGYASNITGKWRNNLFSCFSVFCKGTFWMAFICPLLQTAQLMTRFNLSWLSNEAPPETVRKTFVACTIVLLVFWTLIDWTIYGPAGIFPIVLIAYLLYLKVVQTKLRGHARRRYDISGNVVLDFFTILFCGCCSTIQMVRHTHDETMYPYVGCATDGLPLYAPALINTIPSRETPPPAQQAASATNVPVNTRELTVQATIV